MTATEQEKQIEAAKEKFGQLIREDLARIEAIKNAPHRKDFKSLKHIKTYTSHL